MKLVRAGRAALLAAVVCAGAAQTAHAAPPAGCATQVRAVEGIVEYRCTNGLQLLLVQDDSKPTTTVNLTIKVGSRFENYGETGMAHLLEHMMFKGTPTHPKVWAEFEKRGLAANGSTSYDRTNYTATFSANPDNLNWYVGWLADALVHSNVARRDLDTEMTVVRNEMEMGENSPGRTLYEKTLAVMYDWHNYGKSTIGARSDVENVDIPRLQAFYRLYYQPDNATLIVSGKFDPRTLLATVASSFGKIPAPKRVLPTLYTLDPAQEGERSVTLRRTGGAPLLYAGYHVPPAAAPDYADVELLSIVMGDTPSGRLHKRLTEQKLASATFGSAQGMADPGYAVFGAQLSPGQDVTPARDAMLSALESVAKEPIGADELERARGKWLKDWEQQFTNPETVGLALSESIAQGDWRMFFLLRDRVRAAKLPDVQRVAEQNLLPDNRTLGVYQPTEHPQRPPVPARVDIGEQMAAFHPQDAASAVEAFDATPENIDQRTQRFTLGGLQVALLPKGTRGGAVQAMLVLHFGDEKTLFGQEEVAEAVGALLDKGTSKLSREQVQDKLDQLQTEIGISAGAGVATVRITSVRAHLADAITLVGQLLRDPALPDSALDEVKRQELTSLEQQRKRPEAVAANALARLGDPYPLGDVRHARTFDDIGRDILAVDIAQVRAFHQRFYSAAKAEFAAVGDLDPTSTRAALAAAFADWPARGDTPFARIAEPLVAVPPQRLVLAVPDNQNATMLVAQGVALTDADPDYAALTMANYLLGGGGNSRLWKRIREAEGLSYDVRSSLGWNSSEPNTPWQASAIFAPQNRDKVESAFDSEVARALKDGFTAAELADGQRGLLNYRRLGRAQDSGVAALWARNLYLGRTFATSARVDAALAALTLEQVNAALRKYIVPTTFSRALAGDFKRSAAAPAASAP